MTALRERNAALRRFQAWKAEHPSRLDPTAAIAAVGFLYDLLPPEARHRESDPEFEGVRHMRQALAVLGPRGD